MRCLLLLLSFYSGVARSADVDIGPYTVLRNMADAHDYSDLFAELKDDHIEFSLSSPDNNVLLNVKYYQQRNIESRDFTISVIEQSTEIFFDWIAEKGYMLTNDRRDHRSLSVYDLDYSTLNNDDIIDFVPVTVQRQFSKINGLYEAHRTPDNSNSILLGSNRPASDLSRATTIAHELAHWWCDYFRIYDRYYVLPNDSIDMEGPAYEFQRYFQARYNK